MIATTPTLLPDMIELPGGTFKMGSERFYPEEAPLRTVRVGPFRIDRSPVTNREFARLVEATGYRTVAEIAPDPADQCAGTAGCITPWSTSEGAVSPLRTGLHLADPGS